MDYFLSSRYHGANCVPFQLNTGGRKTAFQETISNPTAVVESNQEGAGQSRPAGEQAWLPRDSEPREI